MKKLLRFLGVFMLLTQSILFATSYITPDQIIVPETNNNRQEESRSATEINRPIIEANKIYKAPGDGSCLFWSVATAYLWPARNNDKLFKEKYENLFGSNQEADRQEVQNLLKNYDINNYSVEDYPFFTSQKVNNLVRNVFRNKVVDFLKEKLDLEKITNEENKNGFFNSLVATSIIDLKEKEIREKKLSDENASQWWDNLSKEEKEKEINKYLKDKRKWNIYYSDTWGDTPEVVAIASMLNYNVTLHQEISNQKMLRQEIKPDYYLYVKPEGTINLYYHKGIHYDFYLSPANENE